jgi:DnaJ-class molecular chaperone
MSPWKTATVMKPCPACNGSGSVPKKWLTFLTSPCERCGGRGEIKTVDRIPRGSDKMYRHRENLKNAKA